MILSILVIIAVALITFFHYVQGFFSATLSAVLAVVAAVLALSFHEPLVEMLLAGRFANQAHALALVVLFAGIYILLRLAFDALVPGNVRLPAAVDKAGGAVMGLIVGIFGTGVVVVAAQALPFHPRIGGYARYEVQDLRSVVIPGRQGQRSLDAEVRQELREDGFNQGRLERLVLPVDDMVVAVAERLSDGGALAGKRVMQDVHPDYLQDLFAQRLGVQVGANRTAINSADRQDVKVTGVYWLDSVMAGDAEIPRAQQSDRDVRGESLVIRGTSPPVTLGAEQPVRLAPPREQLLLVVRTMIGPDAEDEDRRFRFSPAAVRLVHEQQNFHPIGTLENGRFLFVNRVDDPLLAQVAQGQSEMGADLVFLLPAGVAREARPGEAPADRVLVDGTFIEVKRMARIDLSGMQVQAQVEADPRVSVMRKQAVVERFGQQVRGAAPEQQPEPREPGEMSDE